MAWCLWLVGCWAVTLWMESAIPAARWMIFASTIGLLVLWPAVRLSQDLLALDPGREHPGAAERLGPGSEAFDVHVLAVLLLDWLSLNLVFQVVIWPMRLYATWGFQQTLWIIATVMTWSLVSGLIVAWGCLEPLMHPGARPARHRRTFRRPLAMLLCLGLLFAEPLFMVLVDALPASSPSGGWTMRISPIELLWQLTRHPSKFALAPWPGVIGAMAVAGILGWVSLWLAVNRREIAVCD